MFDRRRATLSLYSAHYLPMLFSHYGIPSSIRFKLVDGLSQPPFVKSAETDQVVLSCPRVCVLSSSATDTELAECVAKLDSLCEVGTGNLISLQMEEHQHVGIRGESMSYTGSGSIQYFRRNLYARLKAAFDNFRYLRHRRPGQFSPEEFAVYEAFYLKLVQTVGASQLERVERAYRSIAEPI